MSEILPIIGLILVAIYPLWIWIAFVAKSFLLKLHGLDPKSVRVVVVQRSFLLHGSSLLFILFIILFLWFLSPQTKPLDIIVPSNLSLVLTFVIMLVSIGVGGLTYLLLINLSSFLTHNHKRSFNRSAKEINISQDEITLMRCYNQSFFWSSIFFIITSFSEEFIWRGYLITVLTSDFKIHQLIALLTSALSFGSIHYYYRKLALPQILHGLILGALFLLTHTILAPFIAHLTYNFLSLRSMYETLKNLPKPEETTLPKKIFLSRDE